MSNSLFNHVNGRGIPTIESVNFTLTADLLIFNFRPYNHRNDNFSGYIAVKLPQDIGIIAPPVPIFFHNIGVDNSTIALTTFAGKPVTTDSWKGTGIYTVFYDRESNVLQLIG